MAVINPPERNCLNAPLYTVLSGLAEQTGNIGFLAPTKFVTVPPDLESRVSNCGRNKRWWQIFYIFRGEKVNVVGKFSESIR